jgi:hypothetical protein
VRSPTGCADTTSAAEGELDSSFALPAPGAHHFPPAALGEAYDLVGDRERTKSLPAALVPLLQMRALVAECGVLAMAGVDPRLVRELVEELGLNVVQQ